MQYLRIWKNLANQLLELYFMKNNYIFRIRCQPVCHGSPSRKVSNHFTTKTPLQINSQKYFGRNFSKIQFGWTQRFVTSMRKTANAKFVFNPVWFKEVSTCTYTYALPFYRSQNVLWQSQTFCARQKDDFHSVKLVFVPAQKFLKRH